MNEDAQALGYFCKAFVKRILKIYQTIIDTGINQTNREFLSLIKDYYMTLFLNLKLYIELR